jgi:lipoyl(octanoyl) transferase
VQTIVNHTDWGLIGYENAWHNQEVLFNEKLNQKVHNRNNPDAMIDITHDLILCEHPPVFTLGKSGMIENLLLNNEELQKKGIEFYKNNRGGDITYHGPEQVVGYPILDLEQMKTDIGWYMRCLEEVIIKTAATYQLKCERSKGETGVWIDVGMPEARKICAFGVRTSRWVSMHGWALNVNTDLSYFNYIVPCGIADKGVTSMQKELGQAVSIEEVKQRILYYFEEVFDVKIITHAKP